MTTSAATDIEYRVNVPLNAQDVVRVFKASGIHRPTGDLPRIARMFAESNLVISAWADGVLAGVCRALTDHCYCCYLSDLAVDRAYQGRGIGKRLVAELRTRLGDEVTIVLVSVPEAISFYPEAGFAPAETAFIIRRSR